MVVARGLAIEEEEYDDVAGIDDINRNTATEPTERQSVEAQPNSYGSFFERAENAAAAQQQPSRRRRLRNGGSVISASVTAAAAAAAATKAAPDTSNDAMTLPPSFARNRPSRRSSMPSSFGGVGPGPTLGQMQAAFLAQRLQQHRQRQQEHGIGMMPPPMPREAKRRRSIATSTSADEFNLDIDESGRSTPLRSNSSGGSVSASATSTSRGASNPFAIDLDGPSEFLTEDLLQRTCLPQPGQVGFAEHLAGLFLKDVAASASSKSSATSSRRTFSRRMSLPSPQDMSRQAQMTGGGDGGLHHHSSATAAPGPGNNREMMQILRAQHQQLQMQWQAQAQAKAEAEAQAEAESRAQQEGTSTVTTFRRRQQRRSELFTSSGGSSAGTASSMGVNFSPSSTVAPTSSSNGGRVPPPFAFKYSLSDRSLGTGGSIADVAATAAAAASSTAATEGGLQRFKKRPSESIYANNEVEMTDASSHHPQGGTEDDDDEVCIEIHSTTSRTSEQPPSSRAVGVAAAAVSVRLTTGTSGASSSSHSISPPCRETDTAANATIKAPAIRFFNNGVEVNETGVPIVSPAVPAKPLAHQVKIPLSSQAQRQVTNEETDGNEGDASSITANTSSPYFAASKNTANEDEASLSPPLSRSCSVTDVISFAVKRVPELASRMALPSDDEADPTKIDNVLQALYAIASDAKSEASPKAPRRRDGCCRVPAGPPGRTTASPPIDHHTIRGGIPMGQGYRSC